MNPAMTKKSSKSKSPKALRAALKNARRGFACLPIHGIQGGVCTCSKGAYCPNSGKHPACDHGVKDATSNPEAVKRLFKMHPNANVGIATGKTSGIIVLDVDPRNGGNKSLRALEKRYGALPRTLTAKTGGGGKHLFFRAPSVDVRTSHSILGKGVDVQSDGAYVVAPPSCHASGKRYRWVVADGEVAPIVELPGAYQQALMAAKPSVKTAAAAPASASPTVVGHRNSHLTTVGGRLVAAGVSGKPLRAALRETNATFDPPLDEAEVAKVATSVERYHANQSGDQAENISLALLADRFSCNGDRHLVYAADGQFWHFASSHWEPVSTKWLSGCVLNFMQAWPSRKATSTAALLRQVMSLIEAMTAEKDDVLRFNGEPPPVINCKNGELWIAKDGRVELRPHRATSYLRHVLAVSYDPRAACPRFDRAIGEIFISASDAKAMVRFWHELAGYAIQSGRNIPLVMICKGGGSNGKTALMETLVRLIGPSLVAAMAVGDLDKSRFTVGDLLGKQLFLDDDVKAGTKLPDGNLKRLSEAKTVTGEHKFGAPFTFTVRTLPVLLCNNPPSLSDLSYGMKRRLVVVPFDRTFLDDEVDKELFPTIWSTEMPGVLNRALAGLKRVVERGWKLAQPDEVQAAKDQWMIDANPLPAFVDACCERSGKSYVDDLYRTYVAWAQLAGITMHQQRTSFDRNLGNLGFVFGTKGNRGKKVLGLSLKKRRGLMR